MFKAKRWFVWDKYAKIEILFFVFLCLFVPMISDLEYTLNKEPVLVHEDFSISILRRIVWGSFIMIPYYLFYKLGVQQLLIKKKYLHFFLSILLFIVVFEFYKVYILYGSISVSGFLPKVMVDEAAKSMKSRPLLHFTINYLIIQLLEMIALAYFIEYDKQVKKMQELQRIQAEADLQNLRAQLQPHFFFNTLNNIYSLALQRSELTAPLVAQLSSMMRYVLYETARPETSLQDELSFLENYIDVQSVRYNKKIDIQFEIQGTNLGAPIKPFLLFPFIENAFKHGIEEEEGSGFIRVVVCVNDNEIILSVQNSKAAKLNNPEHTKGIGIVNTQKRLALLYPGKHELTVQETPGTYSVLLTIISN